MITGVRLWSYYFYRPRTEYDGRLCFYRCLSVNRGRGDTPRVPTPSPQVPTPPARSDGGRGTPRYLPPPKGTYPPPARSDGGGGNERYLPPWPRHLPPARSDGGGGTPRYLPPLPGQGTYPPPPRTGQHMEYLIRRGRHASCVHAGELSCWNKVNVKRERLLTFQLHATI